MIGVLSKGLYAYLQSVQSYISPPIAAVFLIGLLWRRVNARGALASLLTGFVLGAARLIMEIGKDDLTGIFRRFADINFLHFAILLFVVCSAVLVVVSLVSGGRPDSRKLDGVCLGCGVESTQPGPRRKTGLRLDSPIILTVVLLILIGLIYYIFSG
jgi:SSS family solute:Na+ symporter